MFAGGLAGAVLTGAPPAPHIPGAGDELPEPPPPEQPEQQLAQEATTSFLQIHQRQDIPTKRNMKMRSMKISMLGSQAWLDTSHSDRKLYSYTTVTKLHSCKMKK